MNAEVEMDTSDGLGADAQRYVVHLLTSGFRICDSETGGYHPGIWASRFKARQACADLNEAGKIHRTNEPDRLTL